MCSSRFCKDGERSAFEQRKGVEKSEKVPDCLTSLPVAIVLLCRLVRGDSAYAAFCPQGEVGGNRASYCQESCSSQRGGGKSCGRHAAGQWSKHCCRIVLSTGSMLLRTCTCSLLNAMVRTGHVQELIQQSAPGTAGADAAVSAVESTSPAAQVPAQQDIEAMEIEGEGKG